MRDHGASTRGGTLVVGLLMSDAVILQVASWGAIINLFDLIPVWQLDAGRGFRALDARERMIVAGVVALASVALDVTMAYPVAALAFFRLKRDVPSKSDVRAFRTFVGLVAVLSLVTFAATGAATAVPAR